MRSGTAEDTGSVNLGPGPLKGYLLEEVVAKLLGRSGYRLLVSAADDPAELEDGPHGLCVRGRGARHQADVLGQLLYVPPFSMPLRMFVEAKCWTKKPVGLPEVCNAHGVIHDVNQNWSAASRSGRPQRYQYLYAIFSTSGFTQPAEEYAKAHQLTLIDLSGPTFRPIRRAIEDASQAVVDSFGGRRPKEEAVVPEIRRYLRRQLGLAGATPAAGSLPPAVMLRLDQLASFVTDGDSVELLLAFPSAPRIIALATTDLPNVRDQLRAYAGQNRATPQLVLRSPFASETTIRLGPASLAVLGAIDDWLDHDEDRRRPVLRPDSPLSKITVLLADDGAMTTVTLAPYIE